MNIQQYIVQNVTGLMESKKITFRMERSWADQFPIEPEVYVIWSGEQVIYAGETGSLRGRMRDMIETRNHTIRRTIGSKLFADHPEFIPATGSKKFPDRIEILLNEYFIKSLTVSFLPVLLGRKEIEEYICKHYHTIYNSKGLRKTI